MNDLNPRKKRVLLVFGTRPEAIKMAPVSKAFANLSSFETCICLTGQHREMLHQVMKAFNLESRYNIDVMRPNQDLTDLTSNILLGMRPVLGEFKPDLVLVHGDTTTTFAVSLACYYQRIDVAHVEAGLRTGNRFAPWPEEMNRKLTGSLACMHFAPTPNAAKNLLAENVNPDSIFVTGNTVVDSLLYMVDRLQNDATFRGNVEAMLPNRRPGQRLVLVTGHRRENFGQGFENICAAIRKIATSYPDVDVVFPVHLNPKVQEPVKRTLAGLENVYLIEPLDYVPFVLLMSQAYLILTDSGGVQEEAPSLGVPVLVMRDTTERPEAVEMGTVRLVGSDTDRIVRNVSELLENPESRRQMCAIENPYGDGHAAEKIAAHIAARFA